MPKVSFQVRKSWTVISMPVQSPHSQPHTVDNIFSLLFNVSCYYTSLLKTLHYQIVGKYRETHPLLCHLPLTYMEKPVVMCGFPETHPSYKAKCGYICISVLLPTGRSEPARCLGDLRPVITATGHSSVTHSLTQLMAIEIE